MNKTLGGKTTNLSRRRFLARSAAAGGGLALGFHVPFGIAAAYAQGPSVAPEINAWVVVRPDDTCVIRIARSEMGQGTLTGLAQLVAEELECDWNKVTTESPTPGQNLARKRVWGEMSHRREPRHPHVRGLRPPWRRRRADDAVAGGRRPVAGARWRTRRRGWGHYARGDETHDDLRQGRGGGGEIDAA